ncbi:MAG: hypothetical protein ACYDB2_09970 [Acidimicrobiales bacterium]
MKEKNKRILGIHLGLVFVEFLCVSGFIFEFLRARSGNSLSWAYVFEWPIFGAYGVYMWRKLLEDERDDGASPKELPFTRSDEALDAYNEYLRQVHRGSSNGGPGASTPSS